MPVGKRAMSSNKFVKMQAGRIFFIKQLCIFDKIAL